MRNARLYTGEEIHKIICGKYADFDYADLYSSAEMMQYPVFFDNYISIDDEHGQEIFNINL
jgi:hypothetical protein